MSIYTKAGDKGKTSLFGGKKVAKNNPQIEAIGAVDESTAFIGMAREALADPELKALLSNCERDLYIVMAYLSGAPLKSEEILGQISSMEKWIDKQEEVLPKLTRFILPQGGEAAVRMHVARTVVRRAERRVVEYYAGNQEKSSDDEVVLAYLNRLSDMLYIMARVVSTEEVLT